MNTHLWTLLSALCGIMVLLTWVRPRTFPALIDKERDVPSLPRQGHFTALISSTWVLIYVTLDPTEKLSEWLFGGYLLAWAGSQFGSAYLKAKGQREHGEAGK